MHELNFSKIGSKILGAIKSVDKSAINLSEFWRVDGEEKMNVRNA